jgi:phospholipase C
MGRSLPADATYPEEEPSMSPHRFVFVSGALLGLSALALGLSACSGGGSPTTVPPSYALTGTALTPNSVTSGNTSTSTITVTPANGYTGSVTLACSVTGASTPAPTCSLSPGAVTVNGTSGTSTLTVSTSSSTHGGTYTVSVSAHDANNLAPSNGSVVLTLTAVAVNSASYALTGTALTPDSVMPGNTSTSTITVTPANGYTGSVTLACSVTGAGTPAPTCSFNPAAVPVNGASGTSTLKVSTSSSTPVGTYTVSVSAHDANNLAPSNGSLALTLTTVAAVSASYTLTAAALTPNSVTSGNTSTSTITVTPANGYTGSVTLGCNVSSAGTPAPSCSLNPVAVAISGAGAVTSTLTLSTSSDTPGGTSSITVTASDANKLAPSNGAQQLTLTTAAVIKHIVVIFQENRSTDNLFHDPVLISRGADIASSGLNSLGQTIPLVPIDLGTAGSTPQDYDLDHSHTAFVSMYDGGKMDGANLIKCYTSKSTTALCPPGLHPNAQYKYVLPSDVAPYFALAEQYTFGDRMFQTNEGPSFPAHQFIIAGTSAPTATSPLFASGNPSQPAGCIAPLTTTVPMINAAGSETAQPPQYPCFEHPTLSDLLQANGVTWRYYTPSAGSIWTGPVAIEHICQEQTINGTRTCTGPDWNSYVVIPQSRVLTDIADGVLAQVTWIIPDGLNSDHALSNNGTGPSWVASIVNAIGNSNFWANTAIIITWDDWGGWYDHVAPFKVVNDGVSWGSGFVYGFRVPLIVVSPYAKAAYVTHAQHDFGSILKYIETNFKLPSLGYADTPADDMAECFNLTQSPLAFKTIPAPLNAAHFINDKHAPVDPDDD